MQNSSINNENKFYLMLCELHNPNIHGKTSDSDANIENHYLVFNRYNPQTGISFDNLTSYEEYDTDSEYDSDDEINDYGICKIDQDIKFLKEMYSQEANLNLINMESHPTIRNYTNIVTNSNYIKPEIGLYIILPTQESIAILKTFWIRIIQKKWKKVYKERQNIIKKRCNYNNLSFRELTGRWPDICFNLPSIKGMLSNLI